jgi:hypothetical protein
MLRFPFSAAVFAATVVGLAASGSGMLAQDAAMHAPDGGTRQRVESIEIPPQTNAPFSAVVTTEWTRIMPDGSTGTMKNHRTVARDSLGRIFQERRSFTPDGDKQITRIFELDYQDTARHEMSVCRPDAQVCTVYRYDAPAAAASMPKAGLLPNGMGTVTREDLGPKTIEGVEVVGSREVTTLNAGAMGNEKPQPVVKEFWYSPVLGINVITRRFDPRASAVQNFVVSGINLGEPDAKMFEPPAGYRMVRVDAP